MALARSQAATSSSQPTLCLSSKPLPKVNYAELAATIKQMGFDGVDLTVRPEGHVLPERAAEDLPRAVETIRAQSLAVAMITTGLTSPSDLAARPTLATAGRLGVPFFKLGYWHSPDRPPIESPIPQLRHQSAALLPIRHKHH